MADYGMKVSKAGIDVKTALAKNLRFNSEAGAFKIFKSGDASFTTDGSGNATATIAHNMGYAPAFFIYRKATARWDWLSSTTEYTNAFFPVGAPNFYVKDDSLHHAIHAYADATNLYIRAYGGKPSTTMNFRYYILVDQSMSFSSADSITTSNDYGLKVAKLGFSTATAKEYQLAFSSKYKIVQYFEVSKKSQALTLPVMFASYHDNLVEEATYVDFTHGLGITPLCFVSFDSPTLGNVLVKAPVTIENGLDDFAYSVAHFVDATRLRVYFYRMSEYVASTLHGNFSAETITVRVLITTEDLAGATFP